MTNPVGFPQGLSAVAAVLRGFFAETGGAVTSSFVILSSAAVTVTTATVVTVGSATETKTNQMDEILVQIDPGQALDLDSPPYNFPVEEEAVTSLAEPVEIENEAVDPISSARSTYGVAPVYAGSGGGGAPAGASGGLMGGSFYGSSAAAAGQLDEVDGQDTAGFVGRS